MHFHRRTVSYSVCLILIVCLVGCAPSEKDVLTQISTIDALLSGAYDGDMPIRKLQSYGNFGIGTFAGLDGEMIFVGGCFYQAKADGKIYQPPMDTGTPFASVTYFHAEIIDACTKQHTYQDFREKLDGLIHQKNHFLAILVDGLFSTMKVRSVPAQIKPYPPLVEVTRNQPEFVHLNQPGYIIGYRLPEYVKGLNVPGYHLHYLSRDLQVGGHILDFTMEQGNIQLDVLNEFRMILPPDANTFGKLDLSQDRSQDLYQVEQDR